MEKELRKQVLQRNLIFWGRLAEKCVITVTGIILCYTFLVYCLEGNDLYVFSNQEIWTFLLSYQIMVLLIITLLVPISFGMCYIPIVISFGSRRKEAVWGLQLMNWLVMGESEAILLLYASLSSIGSGRMGIITGLILIVGVVGIALGQFITVAWFRFGMKVFWFVLLLCTVLFTIIGNVATIFIIRDAFYVKSWYLVAGVGMAVSLYAISMLLLLRIICNYEVRR